MSVQKVIKQFVLANSKYFIMGGFLVLIFLLVMGECNRDAIDRELEDKISREKFLEDQLLEKDKATTRATEEHEKKIAELMGMVDSSNTHITLLEGMDERKAKKIAELEAEYSELGSCKEKIINLEAQVQRWKERFRLAQEQIAEKDTQIFSLKESYNRERKLRLEIAQEKEEWKDLAISRGETVSELEQSLRRKVRATKIEVWAWRVVAVLGTVYGLSR